MKSIFAKSFQIGVYTIEFPNSRIDRNKETPKDVN